MRKTRKLWIQIAVAALSLAVIASAYVGFMSWKVIQVWKTSHGEPSDCIIVLGAAVWDDKPSPALRERLNIALQAYQNGQARTIIASGGTGQGTVSEAQAMKTYLTERGVPEQSILLEEQSHTTFQNLQNSKRIMEDHHFENTILVTHGFHAYRASLMAQSLSIHSTVEPVQVKPLRLKYYILRETAGIAIFSVQRLFL